MKKVLCSSIVGLFAIVSFANTANDASSVDMESYEEVSPPSANVNDQDKETVSSAAAAAMMMMMAANRHHGGAFNVLNKTNDTMFDY